jgi:hypothetical protein
MRLLLGDRFFRAVPQFFRTPAEFPLLPNDADQD